MSEEEPLILKNKPEPESELEPVIPTREQEEPFTPEQEPEQEN
jgi:hypothetical protein